jgi:hypothetical protein
MQTLVFNTKEKYVVLYDNITRENSIMEISNVTTVKVQHTFYEVIQKTVTETLPVLRLPISGTNMFIEK